ncbi:MAG TPA: RNA polymerase sigma factor [Micromonosporaceae bacterium]
MDDHALVAAMVSGDPRGLEGAYRRYADRIFTYCRGLLRDADAAADAVHDTFIAANLHAAQLREPERLRAWLYAIARNECLRQLRGRARQVPLDEAGEVSAPVTDPGHRVHAAELSALVQAAADGLSPGDREVFELMVRHGLAVSDVSAMLGVSSDHAHARLSRARTQLERSLGALLVARTGQAECPDLAGILHGWDGRLTALLRKRISRHVDSCAVCGERRRTQMLPASLLAGYAALPFLVVPAGLWHRIRLTSAQPGGVAAARHRAVGQNPGFDPRTGFPRPVRTVRDGRRRAALAAAGLVVLLLLLAGTALALSRPDRAAFNTPPGAASSAAGPVTSPPPVDRATPTESAVTGAVPTTRQPPSPRPTPPGDAPPAPLTVQATARTVCTTGTSTLRRFTLTVSVVTDGPDLATATLHWSPPLDATRRMTVDGTNARTVVEGLAGARVTWWVAAVATDGRRDRTPPMTVPNPCP